MIVSQNSLVYKILSCIHRIRIGFYSCYWVYNPTNNYSCSHLRITSKTVDHYIEVIRSGI